MSNTGVTWGEPKVVGGKFELQDDAGKAIIELPKKAIKRVHNTKIDIQLELAGTPESGMVYSSEVKLHCPKKATLEDDEVPLITSTVKSLQEMTKGGGEELGEIVCEVTDLTFLAPHGVFSLRIHAKHLAIQGRTRGSAVKQEWVVPLSNLLGAYLLDNPREGGAKWLVLSLGTPLKHGNISFQHISLNITDTVLTTPMRLNLDILSEEKRSATAKDGSLLVTEEMGGLLTDVLPKILKCVSGVAMVTFAQDENPIACSTKYGKGGFLFLMKKIVMYVPNPPQPIRLDSIKEVVFEGVGEGFGTVTINFIFEKASTISYQGIDKAEVPGLVEYFQMKDRTVKGLEAVKLTALDDDDDISAGSLADDDDGYDGLDAADDDEDEGAKKPKRKRDDDKEKKSKKSKR
eukprot:TRINITY_DN72868_c0_g1_i1.p2 TRINITY_DN72868_c0_g1~~TRINITY_DN72868_c0_g1_i1.p2  ORF type:complete len:404 (+),score=168.99 TRINITY_DN72868_c0_g1_i1:48-1259(+)